MNQKKKISRIFQITAALIGVLVMIFTFQYFNQASSKPSLSNTSRRNGLSSSGITKIVTSFCAVNSMAKNLLYDINNIEIIALMDNEAGCPHEHSLSPNEIKILEDADIFIKYGQGLDDHFDKVLDIAKKGNSKLRIVDIQSNNNDRESHDWLSVDKTLSEIGILRDHLIGLFPEQSKVISDNYNVFESKVLSVKSDINNVLLKFQYTQSGTSSETLYDFLISQGLNVIKLGSDDHETEISTRDMVNIVREIKLGNLKYFFADETTSKKFTDMLKREVPQFKIIQLRTVWSQSEDYLDCLHHNLEILVNA